MGRAQVASLQAPVCGNNYNRRLQRQIGNAELGCLCSPPAPSGSSAWNGSPSHHSLIALLPLLKKSSLLMSMMFMSHVTVTLLNLIFSGKEPQVAQPKQCIVILLLTSRTRLLSFAAEVIWTSRKILDLVIWLSVSVSFFSSRHGRSFNDQQVHTWKLLQAGN